MADEQVRCEWVLDCGWHVAWEDEIDRQRQAWEVKQAREAKIAKLYHQSFQRWQYRLTQEEMQRNAAQATKAGRAWHRWLRAMGG